MLRIAWIIAVKAIEVGCLLYSGCAFMAAQKGVLIAYMAVILITAHFESVCESVRIWSYESLEYVFVISCVSVILWNK
jgi:hypothetical protein